MFYALALVLCLAVLFIVLAGSSVLCALGLITGKRFLRFLSPGAHANLLFTVRALPIFLACLVTLGFVLPAFLRFEPRSSHEIMGLRLLTLGGLGALVAAGMAMRSWRIIRTTHRAQKQWRSHSERLQVKGVDLPVYCAAGPSPLLAVTGVFRPRIFIARTVMEKLSSGELFAAIAHELAHVSALDNLKQLILKTTEPPQWLKLLSKSDAVWLKASEMAADEGALTRGASALDLSSALVKVAGISRQGPASDMIAASHLLPVTGLPMKELLMKEQSCLEMRADHLRELLEGERQGQMLRRHGRRNYWPIFSLTLLVLGYAICLNAALPWTHEILELLVR
jgi:Zn-dependent protease with chaperone function